MPFQTAKNNERFLQTVTDALPAMLAYWDSSLLCRFANKGYLEWFGKQPEDLIGKVRLKELLGEKVFELNEPHVRGVLAGTPQHFERTLKKADGTVGFTWAHYAPHMDEAGVVAGFFVLVTDVTPLKVAEAELKLAASVFSSTNDGISVTDSHGTYLAVNPAFTKMTGYAATELIGNTPRILRSNRHDKSFYAQMWREIASKGSWRGQLWNRRKNGEIHPVLMTITEVRDPTGADVKYVAVSNDRSDVWREDEHVRHLAFHDALTDLPNRALLMERLDYHIALALRENRELALLFLDLDGFKLVNDTLGHNVGDCVLKEVARRLLGLVRQTDTVARLGGDEFVIILDNPDGRGEIENIATRVVAAVNEPINLGPKFAQVGTSIGVSVFRTDGDTPSDLIKSADAAMYSVKGSGKNHYRFFDMAMTGR